MDTKQQLERADATLRELRLQITGLTRRRDDLLAANNRYLERARNAEYAKVNAEQELRTALDMSDDWQREATMWAQMYGEQRQHHETQFAKANKWLREVSGYAKLIFLFDAVVLVVGMLVIAGAVPPVFPELPWWWK